MPPAKFFCRVPETQEEWNCAVKQSTLNNDPHAQQQWNSASKLSKEEYLLLRCLWTQHPKKDAGKMVRKFKLGQYCDDARDWLQQFSPFKAYLRQLKTPPATTKFDPSTNDPGPWGAGIFEIPAVEQARITSAVCKQTPMNKSKRPIDEDSVNMSLVAFLIAVAAKQPSLHSRWTPHRKPIKAQFGNGTEMEAQIDGYFGEENGPMKIILETKAGSRKHHEPQVSMQEAAEVVSLLMTQEVDPKRPLFLISQDGADIYITGAVFDKAYLNWITNNRKKLPSHKFLQMMQYGPWNLKKAGDMEQFAVNSLAIMLAVDS
ncbi:hypothetical protein PENPOL_c001G08785 [Penicillium polonicum]|uniref:Uncharacterized protein n=1 Tax=Penicillium polonicum TaxID=60169 RepID=A0A1V6P4K1_PENPO|nr:hypothetical protein PENPOL_c001G08785 [Penicillium polonicum]